MERPVVRALTNGAFSKLLRLSDAELTVPRARSVAVGERLFREGDTLYQQVDQGSVMVFPAYHAKSNIRLGAEKVGLTIREPISRSDWLDIERLESFHYRGRPPFGRQGVLIAESDDRGTGSEICGLVEVGVAPICNSARDKVLDSPFADGRIAWDRWDYEARGSHCKRIASITRVVVDPDFRGLGLSSVLLRNAANFCAKYWQIAGAKPVFCEIVADMLRYHSFAASAGFVYAGQTEGNLHRVANDLKYQVARLRSGKDRDNRGEASVERMQWRYARFLELHIKRSGRDLAWVLRRLQSIDQEAILRHLTLFQEVVRLPKPVFLVGLTPKARRFLARRSKGGFPSTLREESPAFHSPRASILIDKVQAARSVRLSKTQRTRQVCMAFGLPYEEPLAERVSVDAAIPLGSVVLVSGRSGAGKTTFLKLLSGELRPDCGSISIPKSVSISGPGDLTESNTLIDSIGADTESALTILGSVGLSEPTIYLRPFELLSDGQRERARLASLIASGSNCWLVDNFGAGLDRMVSRVVAHRFANEARRAGVTLFLSAVRGDEIQDVLAPDIVIRIRSRRPAGVWIQNGEITAPSVHNLSVAAAA